jgi:hypothetical protein
MTKTPKTKFNKGADMIRIIKIAVLPLAVCVALSGCGRNPFGPGSMGLSIFASIGKAIQKPSAINEQQNNRESAQKTVTTAAQGMAKRLAKGAAGAVRPAWVDTQYIVVVPPFVKYVEVVTNKPSEEDPEKVSTGTGWVIISYSGSTAGLELSNIDTTQITDIDSFHFVGREEKLWKTDGLNHEADSVEYKVGFTATSITGTIKPGLTFAWGKNISASYVLGKDDTASFWLDSLDDVNHTQKGEGHFFDARSGDNNQNNESNSFDFTLVVRYKNTQNPAQPYLRYQDNEGTLNFSLPWGKSSDSLYFTINFYPDYYRDGTIKKNGPNGPTLVSFTRNEKTGVGVTVFYDDSGKEIDRQIN